MKMVSIFGFGRASREAAARKLFAASLDNHVEAFRTSAAASGLPSGLVWHAVTAADQPLFVRDDAQSVIALLLIEVEFDAAEEGEMDDAPGLEMVRAATAIFRWDNRSWTPEPKAIFNFIPSEVVSRRTEWTIINDR